MVRGDRNQGGGKSIVGRLEETEGILRGQKTKGGNIQFDLLHQFKKAKDAETLKYFDPIEEIIIK